MLSVYDAPLDFAMSIRVIFNLIYFIFIMYWYTQYNEHS